jgi:putative phosphoesterase
MKIAVFGDIHGNIAALEAAYKAASERGFDKAYHLGDLGGYAPFINEVVDFVVEQKIDGVQGNYDENVALDKEHCGCRYEDEIQAKMMDLGFNWTKEHATLKTKKYLGGLPFEIAFTCVGFRVKLFHGTPTKNNLYWTEDRDDDFFRQMAAKAGADIMIYGHTHKPYRKDLDGKIFINAGSVGKPKDGDNRSCVALVDIRPGIVETEFLRVPYDVGKMAWSIVDNGLPGYFAEKLLEGK